eukprot:Phypoly_transcript_24031.p1 GENE.Phypoly_transcript_24031~~Phypoly_transcript_24031.p1  ORF type:complete len:153 (+),score=21.16 Phypoly_transcript_24031:31-459(+)
MAKEIPNPMLINFNFEEKGGWGKDFCDTQKMKLEQISKGKIVYSMIVEKGHCNGLGNLHGGATSTLVDIITTYALMTVGDRLGVSTELSVSFLSAAPLGSRIYIEAVVEKAGKSLAFTTCTIKTEDGRLVALGRHTKHVANL